MSNPLYSKLIWSGGLCLTGLLLLIFNLGLLARFEPTAQYLLTALLFLAGFVFFGTYAAAKENWWRLIPAWTLISLSVMTFLSTIQSVDGRVNAGLLFVGLAVAFFHIYLLKRQERWWTVIPGGFMLVIGAVVMLSSFIERAETLGSILFIGMGGVFLGLYYLGGTTHRWWSLIPAAILGIFGIFVFSLNGFGQEGERSALLNWWPLLLIGLGIYVGNRTIHTPPKKEELVVKSAPARPRRKFAGEKTIEALAKTKAGQKTDPEPQTISSEGYVPGTSIEVLPEE
ncbi:MAG: hypothetical protein AAF702_11175 [Chloroflexota bacterium]